MYAICIRVDGLLYCLSMLLCYLLLTQFYHDVIGLLKAILVFLDKLKPNLNKIFIFIWETTGGDSILLLFLKDVEEFSVSNTNLTMIEGYDFFDYSYFNNPFS